MVNNESSVTKKTAEKVNAAIKALNYEPNLLGRNLRSGKTNKILVLIPSISHQFYSKVVSAIEQRAENDKYNVMVCMTHMDKAVEERFLELLRAKSVDGIIFFSSNMKGKQITLLGKKYPIVQCAEYAAGSKTSIVSINTEIASYEATNYLLSCGHTKIALYSSKEEYTTAKQKEAGYRRALVEAGITDTGKYILYDSYSYDSGVRSTEKILKMDEIPTAIFAISDSIAIGALCELDKRGIRVPEDISVMGFDDTSIAKRFIPSITTVSQPQEMMGFMATELLLEKIEDINAKDRIITLPHKLVIRNTVKKLF